MDEKTSKKMTKDLGKAQELSGVDIALGDIMRIGPYPGDWDAPYDIRPKIDKVALYAARQVMYGYEDLEQALGSLWIDSGLNERYRRYRINARRNEKDFRAIISAFPDKLYLPSCRIEIYPEDHLTPSQLKEILTSLHDKLSRLNVSEVEYASDIFCKSPSAAQYLFLILTRFLYCPYQREVRLHEHECGEPDLTIGRRRERNCTFYAGADKDRAIYERGPDRYRVGDAWPFDRIDRVRLETRVKKFVKTGSYTLGNFLNRAGFYRLNKDAYDFRCFKNSPRLPQLWEAYVARDEKGNALGCFHADYRHFKRLIPNLSQYTMRVSEFNPLMERLLEVWKQFDYAWESCQPRRSATTCGKRGYNIRRITI